MSEVRARYDRETVRVYAAFNREIAQAALAAQTFVPPFSRTRMTWIKPSFNWMMYRSGFATKPGQEVVLAIDVTRRGFNWAMDHGVLTAFSLHLHESSQAWQELLAASPVRVQWDPDRDWMLRPLPDVRAVQIGLSGEAVDRYCDEWIVRISDVTDVARAHAAHIAAGTEPESRPDQLERRYDLPPR